MCIYANRSTVIFRVNILMDDFLLMLAIEVAIQSGFMHHTS